MSTQRQVRRGTTAEIAAMSTPAEGEWLFDTTRKAGVWGDGSEDDGIPSPNFAEIINNTWTGFVAVQNGSPADPNDLTITIDERFNKSAFLNGATFKTFARFYVKIPANNTGAVNLTVEFGSGGSTITKDLKKIDAAGAPAELEADDLIEDGIYSVVFDGTQWLVVGGLGGGGGGGLVLIESQEITSAVATVDFTTGIDSTYAAYLVVGTNIGLTSSGAHVELAVSTNGGATWVTSGSKYMVLGQSANSVTGVSDENDTGDNTIRIGSSLTGAADAINFTLYVLNPAEAATYTKGDFRSSFEIGSSSRHYFRDIFWKYKDAGAVDALRFQTSAGNIDQGRITLYGIAHA